MSQETIGYIPDTPPKSSGTNAEIPENRVETKQLKIVNLSPDDAFIAGLPQDLTPEEIEILDLASKI